MSAMAEPLERIEQDFQAFCDAIVRCQSAPVFQRADWQDAYTRLARVRDRYLKEKDALGPSERRAFAKVFEGDTFIKGMMDVRQVGEHVTKRGGLTIRTVGNVPIDLTVEFSAVPMFAASIVTLNDVHGDSYQIDHLQHLQEAERRIRTALRNARS